MPYQSYIRSIIFWGRITMFGAFFLSFIPALYLAVSYGVIPSFSLIISSVSLIAIIYATSFLAEPILYFPILGISGSYMSWLAGNIFNLRVPVSIASQNSVGVTEGTPEGDIISTLGMGVSVFVNLTVLTAIVIFGTQMLQGLPEVVLEACGYILPSLFGAFFVSSMVRSPKIAFFAVPLVLILTLIGLSTSLVLLICLFGTISFCYFSYKKGWLNSVK